MKGKIFTSDEATRTIPLVSRIVTNIRAASRLLDRHERAVAEIIVELRHDDAHAMALRTQREAEIKKVSTLKGHLKDLEVELEGLGWFLVDPREGVVKCYSERESRIVYLTWMIGEPRVDHWFPLKKSHLDRQPLGGEAVTENQQGR